MIAAGVVGAIEVVEGRDGKNGSSVDGVQPGKIDQVIAFVFDVTNAGGLLVRIVRDLVVVAARRSHQAKLIVRRLIKGQGSETAETCGQIVQDFGAGGFQSEIGAVAGNAAVVGEALGVVAEAELVFGSVEAAVAGDQFGLTIALESGAGDNVEDAVGAVAVFRGVAAALHFEVVDVLGIELRSDVRGNIGVGHGNAVDQPGNLMSAANVELVVDHVRAGNVVGDHRQTVGLIGAGSFAQFGGG